MIVDLFILFVAIVLFVLSLGDLCQNFSNNQTEDLGVSVELRLINSCFAHFVARLAFHFVKAELEVYQISFFDLLNAELCLNSANYRGPVLFAVVAIVSQLNLPSAIFGIFVIVEWFLGRIVKRIAEILHGVEMVFDDMLADSDIQSFLIAFWRNLHLFEELQPSIRVCGLVFSRFTLLNLLGWCWGWLGGRNL